MLGMIGFYLQLKGRPVVGRFAIFDAITANSKEQARMFGMCKGLHEREFIKHYEYKKKPGSLGIGLTPLGIRVLEAFDKVLLEMAEAGPLAGKHVTGDTATTHRAAA